MSEKRSGTPYQRVDFDAPTAECDLVMKGGVTSGIVYPYAILELAKKYRFRCIGGTSAGSIAAAFAAAAEFARRSGDSAGFVRLETRCLDLVGGLDKLFQPSRILEPLLSIAKRATSQGPWGALLALPVTLPGTTLLGATVAAGLMSLARGGMAGTVLAALVGAVAAIIWRLLHLVFGELRWNDFGICRGLTVDPKKGPGLTNWVHESIQYIAFGDEWRSKAPLTFGDLSGSGASESARSIQLRMMTSDLSMGRPHALPQLPTKTLFEEHAWSMIFPRDVIDYLKKDGGCRRSPIWRDYFFAPKPEKFPVVVAVRMSLSFPFLISAVPLAIRDIGAEKRAAKRRRSDESGQPTLRILGKLWFADGGLCSNFPIHFFDALLPKRPTFALSLDELDSPDDERVSLPAEAGDGIFLPLAKISDIGSFAGALLNAAKDWQDQLQSIMPGHRERIARIALDKSEGGLNLSMSEKTCWSLMDYGAQAGRLFTSEFDFNDHRWRRSLAAYQQLETMVANHASAWHGGFDGWFSKYSKAPRTYRTSTSAERAQIERGLQALAVLAPAFQPSLIDRPKRFPKPFGRLRGVPDV